MDGIGVVSEARVALQGLLVDRGSAFKMPGGEKKQQVQWTLHRF